MTIRVLLFDLGDTLFGLDPMPDVGAEFASELSRHTGLSAEAARTASAAGLASLRASALEAWRAGDTAEPPLPESIVRHFQPHTPLAREAGEALAAVMWRADVSRFRCDEGRATTLEAFRSAGYRIGAVSNTTTAPEKLDAYLETMRLRPLFETVVYSCEVGVRKPDVRIYREALRRMGVEPADAFFVGDRVREDVLGPRAVGIRAALTHEFRQEEPLDARPQAVLGHIDDLYGVLAGLNTSSDG
jgi:HAD superfamily hydrolase (TIGR01549 family)